jgi:uncharacterized protein (DUF433 family)
MLMLEAQPVPLRALNDGTVRVSGTRVPLETVVVAFTNGATPEEIAQDFPTVPLGDIYAVLAYYLRHQLDVNAYVRERQDVAGKTRRENEARFGATDLRERLLARLPR